MVKKKKHWEAGNDPQNNIPRQDDFLLFGGRDKSIGTEIGKMGNKGYILASFPVSLSKGTITLILMTKNDHGSQPSVLTKKWVLWFYIFMASLGQIC